MKFIAPAKHWMIWVWIFALLGLAGCRPAPIPTASPSPTVSPPEASSTPAATPTRRVTPRPPTLTPVPTVGIRADDLRGIRLKFWFSAGGDLEQELLAQIGEFNRSNPWGITVEGRSFISATALDEQVLPLLTDPDALPQVVLTPLEMLLTWHNRAGVGVSLESYLQDPAWALDIGEITDFWPALWSGEQVEGKRWGLPAGRNPQVLFYNQSWAEALGFSAPPTTPAEFRTQSCAALKANLADDNPENDGMGGWIVSNDPLAVESWRLAFGGEALPAAEGQPYTLNTPAAVKAFTFLRKLIDENCAWTARSAIPYTYFARRQALFYSGSLLDLPLQEQVMTLEKSGDRWTILPYPAENQKPQVLFNGASYALLRSTPPRQLAGWLFLRSLAAPQAQARLALAAGLLPARSAAFEAAGNFRHTHPQWAQAATWKEILQPAPRLASWRIARRVLQDAAWQIFSPLGKVAAIPAVLSELDTTIRDLVK